MVLTRSNLFNSKLSIFRSQSRLSARLGLLHILQKGSAPHPHPPRIRALLICRHVHYPVSTFCSNMERLPRQIGIPQQIRQFGRFGFWTCLKHIWTFCSSSALGKGCDCKCSARVSATTHSTLQELLWPGPEREGCCFLFSQRSLSVYMSNAQICW